MSPMILDVDMAAARADLNASLPETVQIQRATLTSNGAGGRSPSWATIATVQARFGPSRRLAKEDTHAGRMEDQKEWTVTLPALTDVTTRDRIVWGSRTFEVTGVNAARSYEVARFVEAVERT